MLELELIKDDLSAQFPEYTFFITRRLSGKCLVAKHTKYSGADIYVKKDRIEIEAAIPEWKTRFMLGAGAVYKKITDPNYTATATRIKDYLSQKHHVTLRG